MKKPWSSTPSAPGRPGVCGQGYFRDVRSEDLSAHVMRALLKRTGIEPDRSRTSAGAACSSKASRASTSRGSPRWSPACRTRPAGVTINRNCASSLQAINDAAMSIAAGCEDVQIAGGVEHMDHVPMTKDYNPCPALFRRHSEAIMNMGLTAEYLAAKYRISREKQDEFALRSHQLAAKATDAGEFAAEIIPTWGRDETGRKVLLTTDQCIRRDTSLESLACAAAGVQSRRGDR